jgi:hypothetical protein
VNRGGREEGGRRKIRCGGGDIGDTKRKGIIRAREEG